SEMISGPIKPEVVERLSALNPDRIYVENVRSILNVSNSKARAICDTAVRRGLFRRQVLVLCPDGSVGATAPSEEKLPPTVRCWVDADGNPEPETVATSELK